MDNIELNKVLHQPIRTKIIAYLLDRGESDYSSLKSDLDLTDGHMSTHIKELLKNKYITMKKAFVENKPKTFYKISNNGKKEFKIYIENLKKIIAI